ncbi:hypothetical protein I7I53_03568 [Histoplasma capsulatum var. duboisii H88]|uniref:Uncharacterized protein n=1 Tax=Ajellomyces capsulatus (strain H88) TaxID=544711 RepID=A0A8A1LU69_AJEC8|nr:hypothetical protein I7I53_03568 [Histoplasma capsulatum var. duboisii H88]
MASALGDPLLLTVHQHCTLVSTDTISYSRIHESFLLSTLKGSKRIFLPKPQVLLLLDTRIYI